MFVLEDRTIISKGGMGLLWYTKKKFRDFILRGEWKTSLREDYSGVFVRFADQMMTPGLRSTQGVRFK